MYDLAIIGAGPAGIAAAKSAREARLKTVLFAASEENLGGICLNQGCIPVKLFIQNAKSGKNWKESLADKDAVIRKIKAPLPDSLKKTGLEIVFSQASFADKNTLSTGKDNFSAKNIIIASGSYPKALFKSERVILAEEIFNQPVLAKKVLIVGAGYIGIELASLLEGFGSKVELIEKEEEILTRFDTQLTRRLRTILEKRGITIATGVDSRDYDFGEFDLVITAAGRAANTQNLKIEKAGIAVDKDGWIKTDQYLRSSQGHIYACGDVTGKKLLAYTAQYQGQLCVDNICGRKRSEDYHGLPECVFSQPQLALAGVREEDAKESGINFKVLKSNFLKFSSSYVYGDTDGFIKVLVDEEEKIIGAGIISNAACELINIFSLCIKNGLKLNDLKKCLFIHPSLSEIIPLLLRP